MNNDKNFLISAWINKAEKDILIAEHEFTFDNPVYEAICFHCQQAVEKYIKAYFIYLDIKFERTHEIGELITLCEQKDEQISVLKIEADKLTDYAVEIRYPDDVIEVNINDAKEAYNITLKIKEYINNKILV